MGNLLCPAITRTPRVGWQDGILVELIIGNDGEIAFEIHPYEQCKEVYGISLLKGPQREKYMNHFLDLSETIADLQKLDKKWVEGVNEREVTYVASIMLPSLTLIRIAKRLNILRFARPARFVRRILENYLRCPTHRRQ